MQFFLKFLMIFCVFLLTASQKIWANNIIRDAEIETVVHSVVNPLLKSIGKSQKDISIYIVADPAINAFVQGGQNIFIHTGLLIALKNKEQLAAVLAHELGHITGGHLLKSYDAVSEASINALITGATVGVAAILAGGSGDAISGALLAGTQAGAGSLNAFTRMQESSADQAAIHILQKSKINPKSMTQVLKMLSLNERGASDYMRSHPLSLDRIETINHQIRKFNHSDISYNSLSDIDYQRMQAKLYGFIEDPQSTLLRYQEQNNIPKIAILIAQASAYHNLGQSKNAFKVIEKSLELSPNDAFILDLAGQIALESGEINKSIAFYKQAYENSNANPLIGLTYGQALVASENINNIKIAIPILKKSLIAESLYAKGYRDLSLAYDLLKQQGYASIFIAEYFFLIGNYNMAMNQAQKALLFLKENQPEALRARDIIFFAQQKK